MSVLGEVLFGLEVMSHTQLLLAFVSCAAYQLAQGSLLASRGRRVAAAAAALAAIGFVMQASAWMHAAMLVAFAVVGMGVFTLAVWATCRLIGTERIAPTLEVGVVDSSWGGLAASAPRPRLARPVPSA